MQGLTGEGKGQRPGGSPRAHSALALATRGWGPRQRLTAPVTPEQLHSQCEVSPAYLEVRKQRPERNRREGQQDPQHWAPRDRG